MIYFYLFVLHYVAGSLMNASTDATMWEQGIRLNLGMSYLVVALLIGSYQVIVKEDW